MNCPYCETDLRMHEPGRCFDTWVHTSIGKKVEWREEETFEMTMLTPDGEQATEHEIPGAWIDPDDRTLYIHVNDGFTGMIPYYSLQIGAAWAVVDYLVGLNQFKSLSPTAWDSNDQLWLGWHCELFTSIGGIAETAELAICRAAIEFGASELD